ncbi:hypothetical protein [Acinetobacter phage ABPH49]|nr:hypothetical protein [Acinetobacter phage ABPH49]
MKNYDKMTTFQLNAEFLKMIREKSGWQEEPKIVGYPHAGDNRSVGVVKNDEYHWYDFCSNAGDSFRFLMNGGVTQIKLQNGLWYAITEFKGEKVPRYSAIADNPLKAGVIALLKEYEAGAA